MEHTIGMIGLGRMGANMAALLVESDWRVVGADPSAAARTAATETGVDVVADSAALVDALAAPRTVWLMVPSEHVDSVLEDLVPHLEAGDTVIDGGNSFYQDSRRRHEELAAAKLHFLDVGTSGGVSGARHGASLMVGGDAEVFATHEPLFAALAAPEGYARVGGPAAGHFVKMVHNGIEYGMMGAIAEGMSLLNTHQDQFAIDLAAVFQPYAHGSIIESRLLHWLQAAYEAGQIGEIRGEVPRGETEDEMEHITTLGDAPVLAAALRQRQATRDETSYVGRLIAAMRNQFGGHTTLPRGNPSATSDQADSIHRATSGRDLPT